MPVIALGSGLAVLAIRTARSDAPDTTIMVMSAAGSCASLAMIFGSPVISALILIEAAGLGGPTLPLILLPALLSAGIGSLVYLGMGQLTGLSTSAYALNPLDLPAMPQLTVVDFLWTLVVAVLAAVATFAIVQLARRVARPAHARPFVLVPLAALLVAGLAITYAQVGGDTPYAVLFSGSRALKPVIDQAETFSVGTLALLLACKGLAWGVSMGSFRGGPVFPAIFVGTVGGLLASHLPGFPEGAAVATVMAATVAAVLRLPLSSVVIALTMSSSAGADASPLIIVAAAVSYIIVDVLEGRQGRSPADAPTAAGAASTPTPPTDGQPTVSIAPRASSRSG
jgi:H+/Cl- antiporter ClcA